MSSDPVERLHLWERPHVVYLAIAYGISWPLWIGSWLITESMDAGDELFNADLGRIPRGRSPLRSRVAFAAVAARCLWPHDRRKTLEITCHASKAAA